MPGRWEGDLIFGKKMTSIGTLVERHSRFVVLLKLPNGHGAEAVRKGHDKRILTLPAQLRRSITWDPGKEMPSTSASPSTPVCRIASATPRALAARDDNTNNRPLQYLPQSSDLSQRTPVRARHHRLLTQHEASTDPRMDDTVSGVRRGR